MGFRYVMSASCFYRESRNPHPHAPHQPILIFTLEHSQFLAHEEPGLIGRLLGETHRPLKMLVSSFRADARLMLDSVAYDADFTKGRHRLIALAREHLGLTAYFDHAGYYRRGQLLPAMR